MKSKKAKSGKKSEKDLRKTARKELQASLAIRFMEVIRGFGHERGGVPKLVRKAAGRISRELIAGLEAGGEPAREKKLPGKTGDAIRPAGKIRKPVAKKDLEKARKVIARAAKSPAGLSATAPATTTWEPDDKPGDDPVSPS